MKINFNNLLLIILILFIGNCTVIKPTTPNESVICQIETLNINLPAKEKQNIKSVQIPREIQEYLINLYSLDSELALEIGRLPKFQREISPDSGKALNKFVHLVKHATNDEINNLKAVINEGIPEIRKFSAPLQAIIWLLEKDETFFKSDLFNWSLDQILFSSWKFGDHHWKGKDFDEVTDRLNSPILIGYYVKGNFSYASLRRYSSSAHSIFKRKIGNCAGYADFQYQCLKKAGYNARIIKVKSPTHRAYHVVCEFKDKDGIIYIIDNSYINAIITKDRYTKILPQIGFGKY
jgi:hypothetical protein